MVEKLKQTLSKNLFERGREISNYILYKYINDVESINQIEDFKLIIDNNGTNYYGAIYSLKTFIKSELCLSVKNKEYNTKICNNDVIESLANYIYSYILNFYLSKILIFEKSIALEHLLNKKNQTHSSFLTLVTNNVDWIYYFLNKYPVGYYLISNFIESQIKFANEILFNLNKDYFFIKKKFQIDGELKIIEIAKGDLHKSNKSVSKISFEKGVIYYKPRDFIKDKIVTELLLYSNTFLKVPKFADFGNYGYTENIESDTDKLDGLNESNRIKMELYFAELGKATRFIQIIQFEDVIFDNVIYNDGFLYLIDVESFFVPKKMKTTSNLQEVTIDELYSPLSTGAIPTRQGVMEHCNSIMLPSKISSNGKLIGPVNDSIFNYTFSKSAYDNHLPSYYKINNVQEYIIFCKIFCDSYENFSFNLTQVEEVKRCINTTETRVIFRETIKYFQLLMHCRSSEFMTSTSKYIGQLSVILPTDKILKEDKVSSVILKSEFTQLLNGDIPIFSVSNGSLLDDNSSSLINNYYNDDSRFQNLDTDLNYSQIIYEVLKLQLPDKEYFKLELGSLSSNSFNLQGIINIQNFVYQKFIKLILSSPKKNRLITTYIDNHKLLNQNQFVTNIAFMRSGLFDGIDGVIISILKWSYHNNKLNKTKVQLLPLYSTFIKQSSLFFKNKNYESMSLMNSNLSSFVTLSYLHVLWEKVEGFEDYSNQFIELIRTKIVELKGEIDFSINTGITATIVYINNNKSLFNKNDIETLYEGLLNKIQIFFTTEKFSDLIEQTNGKETFLEWSPAKELSGILLLLNLLDKYHVNNTGIVEMKLKIETLFHSDFLKSLNYLSDNNYNQSWSNGINGVISIALALDNSVYHKGILKFYKHRCENINYSSFSLSGGNLGSLGLLEHIESKLDLNINYNYKSRLTFSELFNLNNDKIIKSMLPNGLYNGLCGFLELNSKNENVLVLSNKWFCVSNLEDFNNE